METKQITIDSSLASTRLDKAISKELDFSRKRVKDLLDQKKILVNQKSEKASYILTFKELFIYAVVGIIIGAVNLLVMHRFAFNWYKKGQ